jgi:hypothetical protein
MSDMGEMFNDYRQHKKELKAQYGVPCPSCTVKLPKAQAKILMPGQKCWCGYKDKREKLTGTLKTSVGTEER